MDLSEHTFLVRYADYTIDTVFLTIAELNWLLEEIAGTGAELNEVFTDKLQLRGDSLFERR